MVTPWTTVLEDGVLILLEAQCHFRHCAGPLSCSLEVLPHLCQHSFALSVADTYSLPRLTSQSHTWESGSWSPSTPLIRSACLIVSFVLLVRQPNLEALRLPQHQWPFITPPHFSPLLRCLLCVLCHHAELFCL